ncbi:MAG: hypothetical protein ACJAVV_001236 [Alphaproteobacteria bacterium]|jgi:hypothetical protein
MGNVAHAGLIKEIWQAKATRSSFGIHVVGSVLSWSVTYDNTSTTMTMFNDGEDRHASTSDDTVEGYLNLTGDSPSGSFYSDAIYDFNNVFMAHDAFIEADSDLMKSDNITLNNSWRTSNTSRDVMSFVSDGENMYSSSSFGSGVFITYHTDNSGPETYGTYWAIDTSFNNLTLVSAGPVSELDAAAPPLALMIVSGLLVSGFESRRKKTSYQLKHLFN